MDTVEVEEEVEEVEPIKEEVKKVKIRDRNFTIMKRTRKEATEAVEEEAEQVEVETSTILKVMKMQMVSQWLKRERLSLEEDPAEAAVGEEVAEVEEKDKKEEEAQEEETEAEAKLMPLESSNEL